MTEAEWLACGDHSDLLAFLHTQGVGGFRKYRLLLVAYCRTFLPVLLKDERTRRVVEVAEDYADGVVEKVELAREKRLALKAVQGKGRLDAAVRIVTDGLPMRQAVWFPHECLRDWRTINYRPTAAHQRRLGQLIRDLFGNPFRPVALDPSWLAWNEGTVVKLAQGIYQDRTFDHLPVLADALEEAGCSDDDILGHLRGPGPHVRGCWPVDLCLGKS
jgi:hypothetical protein